MSRITKKMLLLVLLSFLFLPLESRAAVSVRIKIGPPARRVTVVKPKPYHRAVWVQGHWQYKGGKYVWKDGHWVKHRAGYVYIQGTWKKSINGWYYQPGRWVKVG